MQKKNDGMTLPVTPSIAFTGGGTAGHVIPNMVLISALQLDGWRVDYIGSTDGVEKAMIMAINVPYHAVSTGKLRRYFSWKNFLDPFRMLWGIGQAFFLLRQLKSTVVFSKGGFVAFPVVVGAWLNRIPIIAHESDMSPGLANRLSFPFVQKICVTFSGDQHYFKRSEKVRVTGTPIRPQLMQGDAAKGLTLCGFTQTKPCLLVIGGSQGAQVLNHCVRQSLDKLCERFQVIHLCGKGKVDLALTHREGYCQLEYANEELADFFAASELVISRAGANALYEILALSKPHVLVPLPATMSRGDQLQNARYFEQKGISTVVYEEKLCPDVLMAAVYEVSAQREVIIHKIKELNIESATTRILSVIKELVRVVS